MPSVIQQWFAADGSTTYGQVGLYVRFAKPPATEMTILDIDGGALGYLRITAVPGAFLGLSAHFQAEFSYGGNTCSVGLGDIASAAGRWQFIAANYGGCSLGGGCVYGQAWVSGTTLGAHRGSMSNGGTGGAALVDCNLGWGVNLSGTADDFPNASGYVMSKLVVASATGWPHHADEVPPINPFVTDPTPTTYTGEGALYLCEQPIGALVLPTLLLDGTSNHFDLTPGPQGCAIVPQGPY